jgi:hypothetical protein
MRLIKQLAEQIENEVCGALEYAKDALDVREHNAKLAEQYHDMALTEYKHATALHDYVLAEIEKAHDSGITAPQKMLNKWDAKHAELIEKMAEAKIYMEMYR